MNQPKRKNFFAQFKRILDDEDITTTEKLILVAILSYRDNKKYPFRCNPSYPKIMKRSSVKSRSTINNALIRLQELNILIITKKGRSNWYHFTNY